jgi:hypothetical protein
MAKRKQEQRSASDILFYRYFDRVEVSMMKLPQIDKDINAIIAETAPVGEIGERLDAVDAKMKLLVEKYRV